jgi:hypothetical protein
MAEIYAFFDIIISAKYIDCNKVKKIDFPDKINKIILEVKDNQKKLQKEKIVSKKSIISNKINELNLLLFQSLSNDKKYLNDLIEYLNKIKEECNKKYISYIKSLILFNNRFIYDKYIPAEELKSHYMSLYKIFIEIAKYIIKKLNIDKKILNEMKQKFFLDKDIEFIRGDSIETFNYFFTFNNEYKLEKKYSELVDQLTKKYKNFKFNSITKNEIDEYYLLFTKLLHLLCNDKLYIKLYIKYVKSKNDVTYTRYINFLNLTLKFWSHLQMTNPLKREFVKSLSLLSKKLG